MNTKNMKKVMIISLLLLIRNVSFSQKNDNLYSDNEVVLLTYVNKIMQKYKSSPQVLISKLDELLINQETNKHLLYHYILFSKGTILWNERQFENAKICLQSVTDYCERIEMDEGTFRLYIGAANIYAKAMIDIEDYEQALLISQKCLKEISRYLLKSTENEQRIIAMAYFNYASIIDCNEKLGRKKETKIAIESAKSFFRERGLEKNEYYYQILEKQVRHFGDIKESELFLDSSQELLNEITTHLGINNDIYISALVRILSLSDYCFPVQEINQERGDSLIDQIKLRLDKVEIFPADIFRLKKAQLYTNYFFSIYLKRHRYFDAFKIIENAENILANDRQDESKKQLGMIYYQRGNLLMELGNRTGMIENYKRSLRYLEEFEEQIDVAYTLEGLYPNLISGVKGDDIDSARYYFTKATQLETNQIKKFGEKSGSTIFCYRAFGDVLITNGDTLSAMSYFRQAYLKAVKIYGENSIQSLEEVLNISGCFKLDTVRYLSEIKPLLENEDIIWKKNTLFTYELGEIYSKYLSNYDKALKYLYIVAKSTYKNLAITGKGMSDLELLQYFQFHQKDYQGITSQLFDNKELINFKNSLYQDSLYSILIDKAQLFYLIKQSKVKSQEINIEIKNLKKGLLSHQNVLTENEISRLEREKNNIINSELPLPIYVKTIEESLDKDESFVSIQYFLNKNSNYIFFLIGGNNSKSCQIFFLGEHETSDSSPLGYLPQKLLKEIKGKKRIYISPDGIYNTINIGAIVQPNGRLLMEDYDIRIVTSARELIEPKEKKNYENTAVLVGNPTFNLAAPKQTALAANYTRSYTETPLFAWPTLTRGSIAPLPNTKAEVENIGKILQTKGFKTQTLLGEQALEEAVKSVKSPRILHIATHGFFEADVTKKDSLQADDFMGIQRAKAAENPLLRSGLLLAGAENYLKTKKLSNDHENGILTAYEAMNLDLENTELVVLSACETGLGEIKNGEGVYGLQRALRIAGAQSVLMSLWKVPDAPTKILMETFYDNWLTKGMNKHEALKQAQLSVRKMPQYTAPVNWAAFVLVE